MKIFVGIPVRMASTRFPGKPLAKLRDSTLLGNVIQGLAGLPANFFLFVAGCDEQIEDECSRLGIDFLCSPVDASSPAVRVALAMKRLQPRADDIVVVVQGDEPMVQSPQVMDLVRVLQDCQDLACANIVTPCSPEDYASFNVVKVVADRSDNLIYLSRAPIPSTVHPLGVRTLLWKQAGIIGFRWSVLSEMSFHMEQSPLELAESIEILRLIENGFKVRAIFSEIHMIAVDTPSDLSEVERHWRVTR